MKCGIKRAPKSFQKEKSGKEFFSGKELGCGSEEEAQKKN